MLTFEAPFYQIKDVIVFRDHAVKTQFYYLAGLPKLSLDANRKPQFSLLKYQNALDAGGAVVKNRDALGGAFLMLGVDCAVDPDSIKGELSSQAGVDGDITLTPVLYTGGTAQIVVLDYQPPSTSGAPTVSHFVKAVVGSTTPSLLGDQRAIFSVSLDTDAATLIEAAYDNDMSPIGVIYQLQFSGLRPALSVSAEVDYQRVYDQLKIDFQFGLRSGSGGGTSTGGTGATSGAGGSGSTTTTGAGAGAGGTSSSPGSTTGADATTASPPLDKPIQLRVQTGGVLGTSAVINFLLGDAKITDGAGEAVKLDTPASGQTKFRWTVPGMKDVQFDFPAGTYFVGDTYTISVKRVISPTFADTTGKNKSPVITPVTPAAAPQLAAPPAVNRTGTGTGTNSGAASAGTQVAVDVNIDYTLQKLRDSGAIKINIVREQEGKSVDDMQKEAMDLIKNDILNDFFKPQMTVAPLPAAVPATANANASNINSGTAGTQGTKVSIGFQLQEIHQDELRTRTFDYTVQAPVTQTHAPNGFFSALIGKTSKADLIKEVKLDDDFFKVISVNASSIADFGVTDLKTVVLDVAYGGTVDEPATILSPIFTAADNSAKTFQTFIDGGEMSYRYRSSYFFGQNPMVGGQTSEYHTDWLTTLSRSLVVNPQIDVPMLHVYVAQGLIDWDLIAQIETTLSYDDPASQFHAERSFQINQSFQRDEWIVRLTNPALTTYNVQHTWILKDNLRRITGPVQQMSAAQLFVFDPFVDRLPVIVQPEVDPANVSRLTIAFHYEDAANQLDVRKLVEIAPPFRTTTVILPLMNAKKREYAYQATIYRTGGAAAENLPELTTDQMSIVIADGSLPFDVSVILVGDLVQAGLAALQVDLQADPLDGQPPAPQSHLFQPGGDSKWIQRLTLRSDRPSHTYQVQTTAFYAGKDPYPSSWNDHDTSILVIQPSHLEP
jgi:hypothetical protein